jgi:hypothetical protein
MQAHELVRISKRGFCVYCKGLKYGDRPKKRVALGQIAANQSRESTDHKSRFGCKQCDVYLCNKGGCFEAFYRE